MTIDVFEIITENESKNRAERHFSARRVQSGRISVRGTLVNPAIGRVDSLDGLSNSSLVISERGDSNARVVR